VFVFDHSYATQALEVNEAGIAPGDPFIWPPLQAAKCLTAHSDFSLIGAGTMFL
jgi:hypothetical protein